MKSKDRYQRIKDSFQKISFFVVSLITLCFLATSGFAQILFSSQGVNEPISMILLYDLYENTAPGRLPRITGINQEKETSPYPPSYLLWNPPSLIDYNPAPAFGVRVTASYAPWADVKDPRGYSLNRYNSSTDPYYTLPILYSDFSMFSWMFRPNWNPLNGYITFIQNKIPSNPSNQGNQGNNSVSKLINKQWELQSFGIIGEEESLIPDTEITIQFDTDKRFDGNGCNVYFGTYNVSKDSILSISPPGSTDMACFSPPGIMEQEEEYLEALGSVCSFEINHQNNMDNLKLFYDNNRKVLNFMGESSAVIPGWESSVVIPGWLKAHIAGLEQMPVANPPAKIIQYAWNDKIVYYEPPKCCDIWSILYDAEGNIICHPGGGISGEGDFKCPGIMSELKEAVVIWEDERTYP